MKNCDNYRNLLEWGGTNQQERLLKALVPDSVQLDDRSIEDLMVFTVHLAEQFNYYNEENLPDGNWQPFWQKDPLFLIAFIAATDTDSLEERFRRLETNFWLNRKTYDEEEDKSCAIDPCPADMEALVQHILHTARLVALFWFYSESVPNLRHCLQEMIDAELAGALRLLIAYDKGSGKPACWEDQYANWFNDPVWKMDKAEYECIGFIVPCDEAIESLKLLKNDVFSAFLGALIRLRAKARTYLDQYWKDPGSVAGNAAHAPHIALFLAFLHLLEHLKKQVNGLPAKHLDFYYKEILRLEKKAAIPDKVHLVFDLAANVSRYLLEKDAVAKAGKDKKGKDLWYLTEKPLGINRGKIAAIRTLYIEDRDSPGGDILRGLRLLDPKGEDGAPKDLKSVQPFRPFGNKTQPEMEVGFAIASPQLELGLANSREIKLFVYFEPVSFSAPGSLNGLKLEPDNFKAFISTGNEFTEITPPNFNYVTVPTAITNPLEFDMTLDASFPAVTAIADTPGNTDIKSDWPILKIILNKDATKEVYDNFRLVKVEKFEIEVKVVNVQDVVIQNGNSFLPLGRKENADIWGAVPSVNATCHIGSREMFSKKVEIFELAIDWNQIPDPASQITLRYLAGLGPNWQSLTTAPANPTLITDPITWNVNTPLLQRDPNLRAFNSYENTLSRGFLELILSTFTPPITPQPFLGDVTLGYTSKEEILINGNPYEEYFHLLPWGGYIKIDIAGSGAVAIPLLPTFEEPREPNLASGEFTRGNLYIGIQNAVPSETLALLFQIEEGTEENPDAQPPDVAWSYWREMNWQKFAPPSILSNTTRSNQDTQNSLLQSGIIEFKLPPNLYPGMNTALDPGLFWIRASVVEKKNANPPVLVDALPQIVGIRAQAVKAIFQDRDNAPEHLASPLPPETIRQLLNRRVEIQKIEQPFASFGGRPVESDLDFYRRVSERLRHKNRAITPWDYEHLTLEAFAEIRAGRCVPHANLSTEIAPGSVLVVVMPWLRYRAIQNPLKPKAGVGLLDRIRAYLRSKVNLFVYCCDHLQVINPRYQEIQVAICVKFYDGLDNIAHMHLLDEGLSKIIAPWAYDDAQPVLFGQPVYTADIIRQIEQLPYVDYLKDVAFFINRSPAPFEIIQGPVILPESAFTVITAYQDPEKTDFSTHHFIRIVGEPLDKENSFGCACCGPRSVLPLCCPCKDPCECDECDDPRYWDAEWIKQYITERGRQIMEVYRFEPNNEKTWELIMHKLNAFLETLREKCTYLRGKHKKPYSVVMGIGKTMTAQDVLDGKLITEIQITLQGGEHIKIILVIYTESTNYLHPS